MSGALLASLDRGQRWAIAAVVASILAASALARLIGPPPWLLGHHHAANDRMVLQTVQEAILHYREDYDGECPPTLQALVDSKYLTRMPHDRWGRLPRFTCRPWSVAEVTAAGKDGLFGTGDDVGIAQ